jgi:general secretion pathway protein K
VSFLQIVFCRAINAIVVIAFETLVQKVPEIFNSHVTMQTLIPGYSSCCAGLRRLSKQRGLALVVVLWILTLLTLMAGSFATTMRRETSVSNAIKDNAEAQAAAESGIMLAEFMLSQSDAESPWQVDGTIYRLPRADGEIRLRILSEAGKVDINTASQVQLAAVLSSISADRRQQQQLLNAILDWRDEDDDTRTLGAERRQYRQAGLHYGPGNAAFQSLQELQLVLGMDQVMFTQIEPWITVYSDNEQVDYQAAAPELLALIGAEMRHRNISDEALEKRLQGKLTEDVDAEDAGDAFIGDNQTFTIVAEARLRQGATVALEVVARHQTDDTSLPPFEILDWKPRNQGPSLFDDAMDEQMISIENEFRYDDRP